ncbi:hypothetical protein SERLA73DRAFT_169852 [Serpula lacrymans var. lacrymans S7.3]|uniref:Uncharacterized protein n=2 Tax=Serpula lacrymans var. lacrymans TaxID=341189 RepID=F8Q2Y8_SERL3|nr:uncharacterized protein SERLADRAFT_450807 [Serpula lacrymans var. lacrymans S7.9]EGN97549.1 hypothetical protein SERLA73DRAFT_169852 [Serpula lacrymans var. lacrymans S7.3]EGO23146.1 hypothetical protein SERLADRAFT_450807 [Serpula lacrymans var. lacrymans S7.9]
MHYPDSYRRSRERVLQVFGPPLTGNREPTIAAVNVLELHVFGSSKSVTSICGCSLLRHFPRSPLSAIKL